MRAFVLALALFSLLAAGCPDDTGKQPVVTHNNPANVPAPDDAIPEKSLRELYLDAVKGHDQANYLYSYELPGFPGVMSFSIPNNTPDSRQRWFVGRRMLDGPELSRAALATRGWDNADAESRVALAREWIAAVAAPLLDEQPERFPVNEDGAALFTAPAVTRLADGSLKITAWQRRVVGYGVAGGRVYFVQGTWSFDARGGMTAQLGPQHYARNG
ncbi:MAG: hypothetical protein IPK87_14865 [Planctomycetes bacterium]|nr:hypothetical protein [Planctomycetota bacterium]